MEQLLPRPPFHLPWHLRSLTGSLGKLKRCVCCQLRWSLEGADAELAADGALACWLRLLLGCGGISWVTARWILERSDL